MIRLLRPYFARVPSILVGVLVLQSAQAVLALYLPRISADIIDKGVVTGDTGYIWRTGAWMLAVTVAQMLTMVVGIYYGSKVAMAIGRYIRDDVFHRVTTFSAREVARFGAPTLITRVTNDVQQVQMAVLMACNLAVMAPVTGIFGTYLAIREDSGVSWVLIVAIVVLLLVVSVLLSLMTPAFKVMQDRIDDVNQVLRQQITGIRVVRAFVREDVERQRFGESNAALTATALTTGRLQAAMFPLVMLVVNVAGLAVLWFGAERIDAGRMSVGALFAFLGYIVQVLMAVMMAMFMFVMLPRASVSAQRLSEVLHTESSVVAPATPVVHVPATGSLELRGVGFGYPGAQAAVLQDISVVAHRGQTTAIIGSTGAGKTSLVNLIPRLVDVTEGAVLVDGVDVREHDPDALRERIGLVPQRPYLFSGTVASNLRYGKVDATEAEMWHALEIAQAADFVAAMPGRLDASIAQGGINISGGQRQRLAIARALIRRPQIYVFDDSFSALDLATDARLRAALAPYMADATFLIVAQRISTIMDADQILVLEDGQQVGLGNHRELLSTCPTYIEIVESQMSAEDAV